MDYTVEEYSRFGHFYKQARGKYDRTFDDDYAEAMKVIRNRISDGLYNQDPGMVPKTVIISGLGAGIEHDVCKTKMYIEEAQNRLGRIIWLHDEARELIYLMDVYHKKQRTNHSVERIRMAYREYQEDFLGL